MFLFSFLFYPAVKVDLSQVAHFAIDCHLIKSRKHILAVRRISFRSAELGRPPREIRGARTFSGLQRNRFFALFLFFLRFSETL